MNFRIGQKVSYPNLGVCSIENVEKKELGAGPVEVYALKIIADNSLIFIPTSKADKVRIRPVINSRQCELLMNFIAADFADVSPDWKVRSREYQEKLLSGDIFETADVLKQLAYLSRHKALSFREQRLMEKAKFLVVSELALVCSLPECNVETKIDQLLIMACENHELGEIELVSSAAN